MKQKCIRSLLPILIWLPTLLAAEGPKIAIATNIFNPLLMKSYPVALYLRTGNVVHMARYAHFNKYKTENFYDVLAVNSGGNVPSQQSNLGMSTQSSNELGYSLCFLVKHNGKLMNDAREGFVSDYFGLNANAGFWNLSAADYEMYVKNTSTIFTESLSGQARINSYRLSYGLMMMQNKLFLDINFAMGIRSKKITFDQNLPGTSTKVSFESVDFKNPYLQQKDWDPTKFYGSLMGFLRFGICF